MKIYRFCFKIQNTLIQQQSSYIVWRRKNYITALCLNMKETELTFTSLSNNLEKLQWKQKYKFYNLNLPLEKIVHIKTFVQNNWISISKMYAALLNFQVHHPTIFFFCIPFFFWFLIFFFWWFFFLFFFVSFLFCLIFLYFVRDAFFCFSFNISLKT